MMSEITMKAIEGYQATAQRKAYFENKIKELEKEKQKRLIKEAVREVLEEMEKENGANKAK